MAPHQVKVHFLRAPMFRPWVSGMVGESDELNPTQSHEDSPPASLPLSLLPLLVLNHLLGTRGLIF